MLSNKRIVIAGGSGFIGQGMAECWASGNDITILTRDKKGPDNSYGRKTADSRVKYVTWDAKHIGAWANALEGADIVVNLTGRSVNCRYNERNKAEIINSRVDAVNVLGHAIANCLYPPALWINIASATIYRHAEDRPQDEFTGEMHNDFSVQVCKAWEVAFNEQLTPFTRKAMLRSAIVLGKGGVLVPYKRMVSLGLGGKQGSGRQMFSWIHMDDLCAIIEWLSINTEQEGAYNAAAPGPLTNAQFMAALRRKLHVPFGLQAPAWLLKLGAALIGTETELLLKSRWVLPARLQKQGFRFQYDNIDKALNSLL